MTQVTLTATGPDAGSPEVRAVLDQLRAMIAEPEPTHLVVEPRGNRRQRRADAARQRGRT